MQSLTATYKLFPTSAIKNRCVSDTKAADPKRARPCFAELSDERTTWLEAFRMDGRMRMRIERCIGAVGEE